MTLQSNATATLWKANFPELFSWAEWDDEEASVLFHQGSGETLLLNPLGAFLLKTVCHQSATIDTLTQLSGRYFDLPLDDELNKAIRTSLHTFEQKGLVVPIPS